MVSTTLLALIWSGPLRVYQGSAAGEVQRAEFAVPCDMRKSHVALAGLIS